MAMSPRLELRQSQALVMTPQLMQSIRLLQMTHAELERFIDSEVEKNPLVVRDDGEALHGAQPAPESDGETTGSPDISEAHGPSAQEMAETLDTSLENVFQDEPGREDAIAPDLLSQWKSAPGGHRGSDAEGFDIAAVTAARPSLGDHIAEQIAFGFTDPAEGRLAIELVGHLDENGYLRADIGEVAATFGMDAAAAEAVLSSLQQFDPPGIFARSLAECLAIQLRQKDRFDPAMEVLVAHLELLARRDFASLKRLCGVDESDLVDMLGEIRALDPKPGAAFATEPSEAIVPDVTVRTARDGSWEIELNPAALPKVLVDQSYYAAVCRAASAPEKEFLSECLQSANWLVRSLDQRARTILKVATEIVRRQDGFLTHGISHMRPLNLRMVADAIGMHESTVSRVTANKYMLTPRGVFEMRYFFNTGVGSANADEAHASETVRHEIRRLIDGEDARSVLSDDDIVDLLGKRGITIARRTVAKYREAMNIPSSVQRRREKRAFAAAS